MAAGFEIRSYELEVEDEQTVHATIDWSTRIHDLIDVQWLPLGIEFEVVEGIIETVCFQNPPWEEETRKIERYKEALAPVIAWAEEHRPREAEELLTPGGVLDYSGTRIRELRHKARRHLLLLEDSRNATELEGLTREQLHSFKWRLEPDGRGTGTISLLYPDPETNEMVADNRRLGFRSLSELPGVLAEILQADGRQYGEWRGGNRMV